MIGRTSLLIAAGLLVGCGGSGIPFYRATSTLRVESRTHADARLNTRFERAVYSYDGKNNITIVLFDGDADAPTQAATLRIFWQPRAGKTPISSRATNATIQYVVLPPTADEAAGEVGVYSGAGYVFPRSKPGDTYFEAGVWDANLLLADHSGGFRDQLGQSALRGNVVARRDDAAVSAMLRRLAVDVTARLGYPRFVSAAPR